MESLANNTFHLVYHDIGYQHNKFTRWINSMVTPEVLANHLEQLSEIGTLCSLQDSFSVNKSDRPRFVIWFDDAYHGIQKYGSTICQDKGTVASLSVNSQFALHNNCFWRCELSWLLETHSAPEVANRLFSSPYLKPEEIWIKTLEQYGPEMHHRISEMFTAKSTIKEPKAWHKVFMDREQILELVKNGWTACNHSANHPALVSSDGLKSFVDDFNQNKTFVQDVGGDPDIWVLPFDYGIVKHSVDTQLDQLQAECKHLVRAFYFPEKTSSAMPRITLNGHQDVLQQIRHAITPRSKSIFRRIRSLFNRSY